jgi:hypothetical protein
VPVDNPELAELGEQQMARLRDSGLDDLCV